MSAARMRKTTGKISVVNPEFKTDQPESGGNQRMISAVVSLRESSIITLAAHGVLSAEQVAAAWRFRRSFEIVQAPRQAQFDEGARGHRPSSGGIAERTLAAATELKIARRLLGEHGYNLVMLVCGQGFHIRDLYRTRRERDTATDILKIHLNALSGLWH